MQTRQRNTQHFLYRRRKKNESFKKFHKRIAETRAGFSRKKLSKKLPTFEKTNKMVAEIGLNNQQLLLMNPKSSIKSARIPYSIYELIKNEKGVMIKKKQTKKNSRITRSPFLKRIKMNGTKAQQKG